MTRTLVVVVAVAAALGGCGIARQQALMQQMDGEMAQCRAGDQAACQRYQLILQQYQTQAEINARQSAALLQWSAAMRQQSAPPPAPAPAFGPAATGGPVICNSMPFANGYQTICH